MALLTGLMNSPIARRNADDEDTVFQTTGSFEKTGWVSRVSTLLNEPIFTYPETQILRNAGADAALGEVHSGLEIEENISQAQPCAFFW